MKPLHPFFLNTNWKEQYYSLRESGLSQRKACKVLGVPRSSLQDALNNSISLTPIKLPSDLGKEEKRKFLSGGYCRKEQPSPRMLFLDLETSPSLAYVWGRWKQNINSNQIVEEGGKILTAAWKRQGEYNVQSHYSDNEADILANLYDAIEQSDVVIAHNIDFDWNVFLTRLVLNGFHPPKSVKKVCTLKLARKAFKFNSNKLDDLAKVLGLGRKLEHEGMDLWINVLKGMQSAIDKMLRYNEQDVLLLERVYNAIRAFDTIPQYNASHYYFDNVIRCPVCGSSDVNTTGGAVYTPVSKFEEVKCNSCGHRSRKRKAINTKEKRASILVTAR